MRIGHELNFMNVDPTIFVDSEQGRKSFILKEDKVLEPGKINFVKVCSEVGSLELPVANVENKNLKLKKGQKIRNDIYSIEETPKRQKRDKSILNAEVYTDEQVTLLQRQQLMNLLEEHIDCIASDITELGYTDKIEMEILLKDGATPFQAKPYRLNAKDRFDLGKIVGEYKQEGTVSEKKYEFASPAFLIRKKDGTPRMVVDYRRLNQLTKPYNFPIPNFDDLIEKVYGARYFATLDLASGYLQMPMEEGSRDKTAFITETQTGEFNRAMFGLVNAPMYFAKLMHRVLGFPQRKGTVITFFDDTCVFADTWDGLIENLIEVLNLLRDAKLTLNLSKCRFGMDTFQMME